MSSSRTISACELLARGVKYEVGSTDSTFARIGIERERQVKYTQTIAIVNAIMTMGTAVVSAITQTPNQSSGDKLKKVLDHLRDLLLPELAEQREKDADRVKELLHREVEQGPIKVTPMTRKKSRRKKVSRRGA